ncbi:MAG: hypothetical protein OEV08_15630 [Nitrospira sp.]|nr:hypothetical protein [Nitrospira sp.]
MIRKAETPESVLGVGWYRPEQWALLLAHSADCDELEASHAEWLASAEPTLDRIRAIGQNPIKIDIDVEEMIAWCSAKGMPLDGKARSQFIAEKTMQKDQGK